MDVGALGLKIVDQAASGGLAVSGPAHEQEVSGSSLKHPSRKASAEAAETSDHKVCLAAVEAGAILLWEELGNKSAARSEGREGEMLTMIVDFGLFNLTTTLPIFVAFV